MSLLSLRIIYNDYIYICNSSIDFILFLSGGGLTLLIFWLYFSRKVYFSGVVFLPIFIFFTYLYVSTGNFVIFFMCYELFLLPSFLLVFLLSPNRRGVIASIYFLM